MKKYLLTTMCLCAMFVSAQEKPQLVMFDYDELLSIRSQLKAGDAQITAACNSMLKDAQSLLSTPAPKVTDGDVHPQGTAHDFYAIGNYSWRDEKTGKWERIDGKYNPLAKSDLYDSKRMSDMVSYVNRLTLAWFYSGEEKYATKAAEMLRVWFLNEDTKMNPNLEFSCAYGDVREKVGIIIGNQFVKLIDFAQLLAQSKSWPKADNDRLKRWFKDYAQWLLTSKLGIEEGEMTNNHGSWYTAQVAAAAIYNGDKALARQMVEKGRKQVVEQVTGPEGRTYNKADCPEGSLWREMYRVNALGYSIVGLQGLCAVAACADVIGEDLWNVRAEDGRGLLSAFNFLCPYILHPENWKWKVLKSESTVASALEIIRRAAKKYNRSDFREATAQLVANAKNVRQIRVAWLEGTNE